MKKVAVILLNWKDYAERYLPELMRSLRNIYYPKEDWKLFIVDNETSEETVKYLERVAPEAELVLNKENFGFAKGNNMGIYKALQQGFDHVYLLNMDTVVDPDFLNKAVEAAESDKNIGVVQSRLMLWPEKEKVNSSGNELHFLGFGFCGGYRSAPREAEQSPKEITYASGAAILLKAEALCKTGWFDAKFFMYHEDLDLCWRMRLAGYRIVLADDSVVYHKYEFSKSIKKYYWMERNRFICLYSNYRWRTLILIFPALLAMEVGQFVFAVKGGWWKEKLKVYVYLSDPRSWKYILGRRKKIARLRRVKDRDVVSLFTGKIEFQDISNFALDKIANPVFGLYWKIVQKFIIW